MRGADGVQITGFRLMQRKLNIYLVRSSLPLWVINRTSHLRISLGAEVTEGKESRVRVALNKERA
jgi:hypothetical protein